MSFNGYRSKIEEGDVVILYLTINQLYSIEAKAKLKNKKGNLIDNVFQTPFGALKCADLIGTYYGSKISLSKGWGYVLQPTPELWSITLPHRTQIIYTPDISMILIQLELCPGSVVIESGTGSGSLSHALIRAVKPHGHLFTFDFHESRAKVAQEEFAMHGFGEFVTVNHKDVCEHGFGEELENKADAVFLDLPHPWLAIPHSVKVLKETGGRLCSFSPCIEQVQRSCLELSQQGFHDIQTMEVLQTVHSVQMKHVNFINLDFVKTEKVGTEIKNKDNDKEVSKILIATPPSTLPGHTGYLTFATFPPYWARNVQIELNEEEIKS